MRTVSVLGSTGSIGESTLDVVARFPDRFQVVALAAGGARLERLAEQVRQCGAATVAVPGQAEADRLRSLVPNGVEVGWGAEGLVKVAAGCGAEIAVCAVVGAAGLVPTFAALSEGVDVALANKESLVVGGPLVLEAARANGARILPVDSEHSALFQVLDGRDRSEVRRLVLTASGGPFRGRTLESLGSVTAAEALAHPNWSMGPKITVDSATLMNKGLEVIEAFWLFAIPAVDIDVTIHPQSIVHSLVEFVDGSVIAQMGVPDMRGPIAHALGYPERLPMEDLRLDLWSLGGLTFLPPDRDAFPCLDLAYQSLRSGGTAPAVLNGANEVAVDAFLRGRLGFNQIADVVAAGLERHQVLPLDSVHTALEADREARIDARAWITKFGKAGE